MSHAKDEEMDEVGRSLQNVCPPTLWRQSHRGDAREVCLPAPGLAESRLVVDQRLAPRRRRRLG